MNQKSSVVQMLRSVQQGLTSDIWRRLVERSLALGLFETTRIRRLARLGLVYASLPHNHFAHTHKGFPIVWFDCKSPP
jgi:hypothetical protein